MEATKELVELAKERLGKLKQIIIDSGEEEFFEIKRKEMRQAFDLFFENKSLKYPILALEEECNFAINLDDAYGKGIALQFDFDWDVENARNRINTAEIVIDPDDEDAWEPITLSSIDRAIEYLDTFIC